MNKLMIPVLIIFLAIVAYSFSNPTKVGEKTEEEVKCSTHSDCTAINDVNNFNGCFENKCQIKPIGTCFTEKDCNGQPLVVIQCVGQWSCETGRCNWQCTQG